MTDLYIRIREQPREVLDAIAKSLEVRAAEPAMQTICAGYMERIALPGEARVLEIGCGTGATTKLIMRHVGPAQLVGIDPSPMFIDMARATFEGEPRVSFTVGDAGATGQADASFDLVIAHTVYSHLVDPEEALAEARRVLRPGGQLVIFDGDFATPHRRAVRRRSAAVRGSSGAASSGARALPHAAASCSCRRGGVQSGVGRTARLCTDDEPRLLADAAGARSSRRRPGR